MVKVEILHTFQRNEQQHSTSYIGGWGGVRSGGEQENALSCLPFYEDRSKHVIRVFLAKFCLILSLPLIRTNGQLHSVPIMFDLNDTKF